MIQPAHSELDAPFQVDARPRLPLRRCPKHEPDDYWDKAVDSGLVIRVNMSCPECYGSQLNAPRDSRNRLTCARTFSRPRLDFGPNGFGMRITNDNVRGSRRKVGVKYYAGTFPGSRLSKAFWFVDEVQ